MTMPVPRRRPTPRCRCKEGEAIIRTRSRLRWRASRKERCDQTCSDIQYDLYANAGKKTKRNERPGRNATRTHLLVDRRTIKTKDIKPGERSRNEGMYLLDLATSRVLLNQHDGFVERNVEREVQRMRLRQPQHLLQARFPAASQYVSAFREPVRVTTHSPRPNRTVITSACGNRIFTPYTKPLRAPLRTAR